MSTEKETDVDTLLEQMGLKEEESEQLSRKAINYKIHQAINPLNLNVILNTMVKELGLSEELSNAYKVQAISLLDVICIEHERLQNEALKRNE